MIHPVQNLTDSCFYTFALLHEGFKLVEGFRDDGEVAVLKEKRDNAFLHVRALDSRFAFQEIVNELWCVSHLDELALH